MLSICCRAAALLRLGSAPEPVSTHRRSANNCALSCVCCCVCCCAVPLFIAILPVIRHFTGKWGIVDEEYCKILDPEELDEDDEEAHTEGA
jgi:hypothetical protein